MDYSKLCIDEYDNFKESTINVSVSPTWNKSIIGSPISGSGINIDEFDSVILTIVGPDGQGFGL